MGGVISLAAYAYKAATGSADSGKGGGVLVGDYGFVRITNQGENACRREVTTASHSGGIGIGIGIGQSVVLCSVASVRCMCSAAAVSSGHVICSSSLPEPCLSLAFAHIETCTPARIDRKPRSCSMRN